jgi:DNA modification methylase
MDYVNQIVWADCLDILPKMASDSVKLAICDPPYNNNMLYHSYIDKRDDYFEWCSQWFKEVRRIAQRVIVTPGHGNLWMWKDIEKPWGVGCWFKPGNPASSVLGWTCWEPWLYYCKDYKALGGPDTIRAPVRKQTDTGEHPCPKPPQLYEGFILKTTKEGEIVLDPFCGAGTAPVIAKKLKRKWIGIDVDPTYVKRTKIRLKNLDFVEKDLFEDIV